MENTRLQNQNFNQSDDDLNFAEELYFQNALNAIERSDLFDFIEAFQYLEIQDIINLYKSAIEVDDVEIVHYIWEETGFLPTKELLLGNIMEGEYQVAGWAYRKGLVEFNIQDVYNIYHASIYAGDNTDSARWILIDGGVESNPAFGDRLAQYEPGLNGYSPEFYNWVLDNLLGG